MIAAIGAHHSVSANLSALTQKMELGWCPALKAGVLQAPYPLSDQTTEIPIGRSSARATGLETLVSHSIEIRELCRRRRQERHARSRQACPNRSLDG